VEDLDGWVQNFNCNNRITWGCVSADKVDEMGSRKFGKFNYFYYIYNVKQNNMNKTSQDYQKDLLATRNKLDSLEAHIRVRFIKMIESFPDATVYHQDGNTFTCRQVSKEWLDNQPTDTMLACMRNIEEYNATRQPHVQLDLFN